MALDTAIKEMEERLERREKIALNLAQQLNKKIDECETLKKDLTWYVKRVQELEKQLYLADHVDTTGGAWAWESDSGVVV